MINVNSKLDQTQKYVDYSAEGQEKPFVEVKPGSNIVTVAELKLLKNVPAFTDHVDGEYIEVDEKYKPSDEEAAAQKAAEEAAAQKAAEEAAAAKQLEEAAKLAKGGK